MSFTPTVEQEAASRKALLSVFPHWFDPELSDADPACVDHRGRRTPHPVSNANPFGEPVEQWSDTM